MKVHASHSVELSRKKKEISRFRSRLVISVVLLFVVAAALLIVLLSCIGS